MQDLVNATLESYGKLDVMVNGAGMLIRTQSRLADISDLEWDLSLNTNLRGVFYGCKYAIPHMMERGGSIVNISSSAGIGPHPSRRVLRCEQGGRNQPHADRCP